MASPREELPSWLSHTDLSVLETICTQVTRMDPQVVFVHVHAYTSIYMYMYLTKVTNEEEAINLRVGVWKELKERHRRSWKKVGAGGRKGKGKVMEFYYKINLKRPFRIVCFHSYMESLF